MADAEDGYGDQIPDGKSIVSVIGSDLMDQKIIVARKTAEAEVNPDFIINARTDALRSTEDRSRIGTGHGCANQYLEVGADLAFITYVETLGEVKKITKEVKGPVSIAAGLHYNIKNFCIDDLKRCGVYRVSLPTLLIFSSLAAIKKSLNFVNEDDMSKSTDFLYTVRDLNLLLKK